jgi:vanillate O-demethylase monooxygenase subunit
MTMPSEAAIRGAQAASARMADRHPPFVFDDWYVAGFGEEFGEQLLQRTLLGRKLVLYRTQAGLPVALDDRCAHRSFPLSASAREGDTIVCGYHGFRYNPTGDCIEVPSQTPTPKGIGVRSYRLIERGPVVWIWMGDPEKADPSKLPEQDWITAPDWEQSHGYLHLKASYVRLHENLLDLTHLSYLHANSFGTPDYAKAPFEVEQREGYYALRRNVIPTTLPPIWSETTGLRGEKQAARIAHSAFRAPGMHEVTVKFYDCTVPETQREEFTIRTAHLPTPETLTTTHYFLVHGRNFAQDDHQITQTMHDQLFVAFNEDVTGLALQEEMLAATPDDELFEMTVAADGPAVAMRRYLLARSADTGR